MEFKKNSNQPEIFVEEKAEILEGEKVCDFPEPCDSRTDGLNPIENEDDGFVKFYRQHRDNKDCDACAYFSESTLGEIVPKGVLEAETYGSIQEKLAQCLGKRAADIFHERKKELTISMLCAILLVQLAKQLSVLALRELNVFACLFCNAYNKYMNDPTYCDKNGADPDELFCEFFKNVYLKEYFLAYPQIQSQNFPHLNKHSEPACKELTRLLAQFLANKRVML